MSTRDLESLIQAWCDDALTESGAASLNEILRTSSEARERFRQAACFHGVLYCAVSKWVMTEIVGQTAHGSVAAQQGALRSWLKWRTFASMAAGIALALLCTPRGYGDKSTRILSQSVLLAESSDGQTKPGPLPSGFPGTFGQWSGDESALVVQPGFPGYPHKLALLFQKAEREKALTPATASACDMFRLVDLRPLKTAILPGEATLELSAKFLDARVQPGEPVIFVARLYTYAGLPERLADQWPIHSRQEVLAYAANQFESYGGTPSSARILKSIVTLHPQTDFAVVHLIAFKPAHGGESPAEFGEQYVQEVQITTLVPSTPSELFTKSKPQTSLFP